MRRINIGDFRITQEDKDAVNAVLDSNRITEHTKTREFENEWAKTIGTKYAIVVNSGTSAIIAGLHALKHLAKDEKRKKVITSPLTYIATSNAIKLSGLEPVYGDIDSKTFSLLPEEIEKILQENDPKEFLAIFPVHLMGFPCDMDRINEIARKYNLFVFEDAAQAHGSLYKGQKCGSLGDLSDFSFYVAHNIQAGELGALNTNNPQIKILIKKLKANGRVCTCDICTRMEGTCPLLNRYNDEKDFEPRFTHDMVGFNFKTSEFTTALAMNKLKDIDKINEIRKRNVKYLNEGLKKHEEILQLPLFSEDVSYLGYPIIVKNGKRKFIREELEKRGVETRILFGCIPAQQPSFEYLKEEYSGKLPNADYVGENGFYIGVHQYLDNEDLDYIIQVFNEILGL